MASNTDTSTQSDPEAIDDTRRRRATTTETPRPAVGVKVALVGLTILCRRPLELYLDRACPQFADAACGRPQVAAHMAGS
jgi:hypothetical protein